MRNIDMIILHCADTKPSMDIGVKEIRKWHVEERGWRDIGYHWVIRRDGTIERGRPESDTGAHCSGYNSRSIGICLVGGMQQNSSRSEDNFLPCQFESLKKLIADIRARYPYRRLSIHGHDEFADKECPVFSVSKFLSDYGVNRE